MTTGPWSIPVSQANSPGKPGFAWGTAAGRRDRRVARSRGRPRRTHAVPQRASGEPAAGGEPARNGGTPAAGGEPARNGGTPAAGGEPARNGGTLAAWCGYAW